MWGKLMQNLIINRHHHGTITAPLRHHLKKKPKNRHILEVVFWVKNGKKAEIFTAFRL